MAPASSSSYGLGARDNRSVLASNMDIGSVISSDDAGGAGGGGAGGSGRSMHQAPSLAEAPAGNGPRPDEPRSSQYSMHGANTAFRSPSPGPVGDDDAVDFGPDRTRDPLSIRRTQSASPPRRMETYPSNSAAGDETLNPSRGPSAEPTSNGYSFSGFSPTNHASQGVFPVNGSDPSQRGKANRRRTGPLSAEQRERAAIIRKMGACNDCRRRRVACNPGHHNMSWDDARKRYRSHSQDLQAPIAISSDRSFQPVNGNYTFEPQGMDLDQSPTSQQTTHSSSTEAQMRTVRTPLPSGPRLERTVQAAISLPGIDILRSNLQNHASSIIANPNRSRYSAVYALLLVWEDEQEETVKQAVEELRSVLDRHYHYTFETDVIPSDEHEPERSWRWLSRRIDHFMEENDQRDVLKIFYYNGRTQLNGAREMVLASSTPSKPPCTIRWSAVQILFEQAVADTLVIMDSRYFGLPAAARRRGMLEIIAAGSFEEQASPLARCAFTRALSEKLRTQAARMRALSAADLHAQLLAEYPRIVQEVTPDREFLSSFPAPLHLQLADSHNVPSVLLAPLRRSRLPSIDSPGAGVGSSASASPGAQLSLTVRLDREPDVDAWTDWLRMMPDGVREVKVEGAFRSALR